jgi:integrase
MIDIDLELPNGQRIRHRKVSPVQTRRGAEDYERKVRDALINGTFKRQEEEKKDFTKFSDEFMRDHVNPGNKPSELCAKRSILRLHLVPFFGKFLLKDIDESTIKRFIKRQVELGMAPKTINNQLILLRTILGNAEDLELIEKLPRIKKLPVVQPKIDYLSEDEIQRLTSAATNHEWLAAISLALNCGLRLGELIALKWDDIDLTAGKLWIQRSDWQGQVGLPKSGKARIVPLNENAAKALKQCRHLRGEWIFCRESGERRTKDDFATALERARKKAGLRKFNWHLLRHTFASRLVSRGVSLRVVQGLLGHASINMTLRYAHLSDDDTKSAVDRLVGSPEISRHHSGNAKTQLNL